MVVSSHWQGKVRELESGTGRAVVVCDGQAIHAHHLSPTLQTAEVSGTGPTGSLEAAVGTLETGLIQDALKTTRGNRSRAARVLKTTERILNYKIRKYRIDWARFR